MGKKTLNDFFKFGNFFFTHCSFDRRFYYTVVYCLLIYACPTICAENLLLHYPLIARLSTEIAALVSFRLLRCQRVCFWMHSDVHFCFLSLSFSPSSASPSIIVARCSLSFAHFCFFHRRLAIQSFTSLPVAVSFLVILLFCRRPLIRSLQFVIAIISLPLINFSFS